MLFLFGSTSLMAQSVPTFTMDFKDSSLTEIFDYFTAHSEYVFTYNSAEVRQQEVKINASFRDATLSEILTECLKNTPFTFEIIDQHVVIKRRPKPLAEALTLQGTVYDEGNQPLPGVTVILKGTTLGTATDIDGKYTLTLPGNTPSPALVFSFIGMETREVSVGQKTEIDVTMVAEVSEIDEVVVTGYFNKSKSSFTGAVTQAKREELRKFGNVNLIQALSMVDPSFKIKENNLMGSDPNTLPDFFVRGESSFMGESNIPTFIVDGFEVDLQRVFDMDMDRIESITVLKDASATILYGSRAANGVVVIETRRPEGGKLQVNYTNRTSLSVADLSD